MAKGLDGFREGVVAVGCEAIRRADAAINLGAQTFSGVSDVVGHLKEEALNLIRNRVISPKTMETTKGLVTRSPKGIHPDKQWAWENILGVPAIFFEMLEGVYSIKDMPDHLPQINAIVDQIAQHCAEKSEGAVGCEDDEKPSRPRIYVAGEGSSIAMPGALATKFGKNVENATVESLCCAEVNNVKAEDTVIILSNSGKTDTAVKLAERAKEVGALVVGITKDSNSELAKICGEENTVVLHCGEEKAVGATKSVVEQCFVVSEMIRGVAGDKSPEDYEALSKMYESALTQHISPEMIRKISSARELVIIGREGVHREAALKVAETIGVKVRIIDTSFALHGDEETFSDGDVVLFIEPDNVKVPKIEEHIASRVPVFYFGPKVRNIEPYLAHGQVITTPRGGNYQPVMNLGVLQNLLVRLAVYKGSKCVPDHARKVGDPVAPTVSA
jgi:fructoselysine-6-P-deglycase FrlB-like protein